MLKMNHLTTFSESGCLSKTLKITCKWYPTEPDTRRRFTRHTEVSPSGAPKDVFLSPPSGSHKGSLLPRRVLLSRYSCSASMERLGLLVPVLDPGTSSVLPCVLWVGLPRFPPRLQVHPDVVSLSSVM